MPRVTLGQDQEAIEFKATIAYYMKLRGVNRQQLQKGTGISATSLTSRYKNPIGGKVEDLRKIYNYLRVPEEKRIKI